MGKSIKLDSVSYTESTTGKKKFVPFEQFDIATIRTEVNNHIDNHNTLRPIFKQMPDDLKFKFYYEFLFNAEMMICNWRGLPTYQFGQYPFMIKECEGYDKYKPILDDDTLLHTNTMIREYDEHKIDWHTYLRRRKEYLEVNLYLTFPFGIGNNEPKTTQQMVSDLLDKCKTNFNYELTSEEDALTKRSNYAVYSSRWITKQLRSLQKSLDIDTHFERFEKSMTNRPQPIRNLCSIFNRQLDYLNINNDDEVRVKNLQLRREFIEQNS